MKKMDLIKKNKRKLTSILVTSMLLIATTACGNTSDETANASVETSVEQSVDTSDTSEATVTSETSETQSTEENTNDLVAASIYGQITEITDTTITIALAEQPAGFDNAEGNMERPDNAELPSGEMPSGEAPSGEMPSGEAPSGEMPSGEAPSGEMPSGEAPSGEMPSFDGQGERPEMELTLTGETITIEIADTTTITINGEEKSISDLAIDDTITVMMDGDTVISINSGFGGRGGF